MTPDIYAITDLTGYVTQIREAAAKSLSSDYENDNLDDYITLNQLEDIVNQECLGFDENSRPLLDEESNEIIFDKTVAWINNIGLAKLAAMDIIECAWDDELNEMVFWAKTSEK